MKVDLLGWVLMPAVDPTRQIDQLETHRRRTFRLRAHCACGFSKGEKLRRLRDRNRTDLLRLNACKDRVIVCRKSHYRIDRVVRRYID
jgi:hypothetical protein